MLELTDNQKLYARWKKPVRYVLTNTLQDGKKYLLVSTNSAGNGKAFGQAVVGDQTNQDNVDVTVVNNYIEKDMPDYAVFQCLNGGKLKNNVGYLNIIYNWYQYQYQYTIDQDDGVVWTYSNNGSGNKGRLYCSAVGCYFGYNAQFTVRRNQLNVYLYQQQPAEYEFSTEAASST